jgi:hypothetical protein
MDRMTGRHTAKASVQKEALLSLNYPPFTFPPALTWVKLSGAYQDTKVGPPSYSDTVPVARAYVKAAPQRMVWASDWPHPTEKDKPNGAVLFDLLTEWVPDPATRTPQPFMDSRNPRDGIFEPSPFAVLFPPSLNEPRS